MHIGMFTNYVRPLISIVVFNSDDRAEQVNELARIMSVPVDVRVEKGAAWLAERDPMWAEKIHEAIENNDFDMASCYRCAVGTVLGDYVDHFVDNDEEKERMKRFEAMALGFNALDTDGSGFRMLETVWSDRVLGEIAWINGVLGEE